MQTAASDCAMEPSDQVVAVRAEKAAVVLTTNLPFSGWTQVIPKARLCKALLESHLRATVFL
jgi:hypothetical protein